MTIFEDSRYENVPVLQILGRDGNYHASLPPVIPAPVSAYTNVTLPYGARYDVAANILFGDSEQWWRVAAQNPAILYPDDLPTGEVAQFPNPIAKY